MSSFGVGNFHTVDAVRSHADATVVGDIYTTTQSSIRAVKVIRSPTCQPTMPGGDIQRPPCTINRLVTVCRAAPKTGDKCKHCERYAKQKRFFRILSRMFFFCFFFTKFPPIDHPGIWIDAPGRGIVSLRGDLEPRPSR